MRDPFEEVDRLRRVLRDVHATCQGRVDGDTRRASYLGIRNYIDGQVPDLAETTGPDVIDGSVAAPMALTSRAEGESS